MALNTTALEDQLLTLFSGPPDNISGCAEAWANAMQSYAVGIDPQSTTAIDGSASQLLEVLLNSIFQNNTTKDMLDQMESAFALYAQSIAAGMTAFLWTGTPPPGPVGFEDYCDTTILTHELASLSFRAKIDSWMKTGTAAPIFPNVDPPKNWS